MPLLPNPSFLKGGPSYIIDKELPPRSSKERAEVKKRKQADSITDQVLANKVTVIFDMLGALMKDGIGRNQAHKA